MGLPWYIHVLESWWFWTLVVPGIVWFLAWGFSGTHGEPLPGVEGQCSPSRKHLPTARKTTAGRTYEIPQRTSYPGRKYRWRGLERSVKEREKVRK